MRLTFTEEQEMFRSTVREFVDREVAPRAEQLDEEAVFPTDLFDRMGEMGFYGLRYPEALGGLDADFTSYCILTEELARGSLGVAVVVTVIHFNVFKNLFDLFSVFIFRFFGGSNIYNFNIRFNSSSVN